jgi:hypothetical protein
MSLTRRQVTIAAIAAAATSLFGSSAGAQQSATGRSSTTAQTPDGTMDKLYARARQEGALTLYGGGPAVWYTDWTEQFKIVFPGIAVTLVGGFSNELTPRIDQQIASGRMECDVTILQTLQDLRAGRVRAH